jgi:polyhydroxybutyrate depolymerase
MVQTLPLLALVAFFLTFAHPALAACGGPAGPVGQTTLDVAGARRLFIVRKNSTADNTVPAPVVVVFHPFGMGAQYMESRVSTRLWPGAVMVYPEGASRPGSGYQPSWQTRAGEFGDRDLHFFDAIVQWLTAQHCVDPMRIFAFGYSNGAGFAGLLACERAETIAGIALASGRVTCNPTRATPVAITHGVNDATISYDEGVRLASAWSKLNGCREPPKIGSAGCSQAVGCSAAPVLMCTSPGGHEYSSAFTRPALDLLQKTR